jgi:hypothetical protein
VGQQPASSDHFWRSSFLCLIVGCNGSRVYSSTPTSRTVYRISFNRLRTEVVLSDGTVGRPGDEVVELHLWNERIPRSWPKAGNGQDEASPCTAHAAK